MMKRSILLVALALMVVSQVAANEYMYTPFVREGVKWVYFMSMRMVSILLTPYWEKAKYI